MTQSPAADARRRLPAVDRIVQQPAMRHLVELYGRDEIVVQARAELDRLRGELAAEAGGPALDAALAELPGRIAAGLESRLGPPLRRVINATGIFLHTNLGRAPLPPEVARRLPELLDASCDLELDLGSGRRGDRNRRADRLLRALTGAEAALVVNNNAGAMLLVLAALARGREVVVSRGELVEIGGSFRMPDIMAAAGVRLIEVGTTNRTHLADYERVVGEATALLLKVHPSNYRVSGFVSEVTAGELATLARTRGLPLAYDEGAGLLRPHGAPELADHPSFAELLAAGCDLVCGSGDKLLGGPQAGLVAGRAELVERCRRHPLYRALRPDRATFAALDLVLRRRLAGAELPIDRLWTPAVEHRRRLEPLAERLGAEIVPAEAFVGGGAAPERPIAGEALAIAGPHDLLARLRAGEPPVVGYQREGRVLLDLRTVDPADDPHLERAVAAARG